MSQEKFQFLLLAAKSGDVDEVRRLLNEGRYEGRYTVNCTDSDGWTPLHFACQNGDLRMIRMLVLMLSLVLKLPITTHQLM